MATANDVLRIAASQIGYSRYTDPEQGTKYGRWYASVVNNSYFARSGVPYCAMFVSWVFAQAGQACAGLPGAYCPDMVTAERNARLALGNVRNAQPGDIVYFDWDGGVVDHVGIVEKNYGGYIQTIEGNTSSGAAGSQNNGGGVYRRTRAWSVIKAVVRPPYTVPTPTKPITLNVDGILGPASIKRAQAILGTPADGIISGQTPIWKPNLWAIRSDCITWSGLGSRMIEVLQRNLGVTVDGIMGPGTIKAWQARLGVTPDGYLGTNTAKAIQRALNNGRIF